MMNALGNRGSASVVVNYAKKVPQKPEDSCRPPDNQGRIDILLSLKGEDSYGGCAMNCVLFGGFLGRAP
jgi:hypothetical protein